MSTVGCNAVESVSISSPCGTGPKAETFSELAEPTSAEVGGSGEGGEVSSETLLTEAQSVAEDTAPSCPDDAGTNEAGGSKVGHDRVPGRRGNGHSVPIGTRQLADKNGFLAKKSRAERGDLLDAQLIAGVSSNDTGDATPATVTSEGNDSVFREKVPPGAATERGDSSLPNGKPSVDASTEKLVPAHEFGPVDADYYASLIPKTSDDPEGDCILRKRLEQQREFIAVVDARGKLVSPARDYLIRRMTGLPILLRVKHFGSEADAKEAVYECHDGGPHFTPADLRKMRHDRVRNLFSMNMKIPEIARRTGLDESTIRKIHKRNFPDMERKDGRALPAEKVTQVKEMLARGCTPAEINAATGVSKATISRLSKPAPAKAMPKSSEPEQTPEAPEETVAEERHQQASESGNPVAPTDDEALVDAMPTSPGDDEVLQVDDFIRRALEQAGISEEDYLQEVQGYSEQAVDAISEMESKFDPDSFLTYLIYEYGNLRIQEAHIKREITKHVDERSKPYEKNADLKPGSKKKRLLDRKHV